MPVALAALSALTALMTALAIPTTVTAAVETNGRLVPVETHPKPWLIAFVAAQVVALVSASIGAVASRTGRIRTAKRALEVAVVAGVVPAVVPAVLALVARVHLGRRG